MYDELDYYKEMKEQRVIELHASIRWLKNSRYKKEEVLQAINSIYGKLEDNRED